MKVSPAIPTALAQSAAQKLLSSGLKDGSKDFFSILCSSTQDATEASPNVNIFELSTKTNKSEKPLRDKAGSEQTIVNLITPSAAPQINQTTPLLSLTSFLGLAAAQNVDVTEVGKTESHGGQVAVVPAHAGSYQQPATAAIAVSQPTKPDFLNNAQPALINTEPIVQAESGIDQPQPLQKADPIGADPSIKPVDLLSAAVPQRSEIVPSQEDNKLQLSTVAQNANAVTNVTPAALPDIPAPQPSLLKADVPSSNKSSAKESSKLDPSQKERGVKAATSIDPAPQLNVAPLQQRPELTPLQENSQPSSLDPISAATDRQAKESNQAKENNMDLATAGAAPSAAESTPSTGNLAFALRLSENSSDSKPQSPSQEMTSAEPLARVAAPSGNFNGAAIVQAATESQGKEQPHQHDGSAGTSLYEVPQARPQSASEAPRGNSSEQTAQATAAGLDLKHETASSEPVRNVHLQVVNDNNRVDVRLVDRGGELHVSVKSGDINLAQNLQDHMPELTSRLEQQRFQTEVWTPKLVDNGKAEVSGARDFSSNGNNSSHHGGASDGQGKRQGKYQPDWVEVLENSTQNTGKNYQTWLQ